MTTPPRRTHKGERMGVDASWPREYRLIFALIDGKRTRAEIADLLHKSFEVVEQVLNYFQTIGLIE
jgi:hypothetical protein